MVIPKQAKEVSEEPRGNPTPKIRIQQQKCNKEDCKGTKFFIEINEDQENKKAFIVGRCCECGKFVFTLNVPVDQQ